MALDLEEKELIIKLPVLFPHLSDEDKKKGHIPTEETPEENHFKWIAKTEKSLKEKNIATTKKPTTDLRQQLINLYWLQLNTPTQIMYKLGYNSSDAVISDLKRFDIPTRAPDFVKIKREVKKQSDDTTSLWGAMLSSDTQEIISETIDVTDYRNFQLYLDLRKSGSPTFSYIKVSIEFSLDKTNWFLYNDYPFDQLYELDSTIPVQWAKTGLIGGNYMRIKFKSFKGDTLNSTNYFIIYVVNVLLS